VNAINTLPPNSLWAAAAEAEGILRTTQKEFAHDPERSVNGALQVLIYAALSICSSLAHSSAGLSCGFVKSQA
jgi:hypothetical protein